MFTATITLGLTQIHPARMPVLPSLIAPTKPALAGAARSNCPSLRPDASSRQNNQSGGLGATSPKPATVHLARTPASHRPTSSAALVLHRAAQIGAHPYSILLPPSRQAVGPTPPQPNRHFHPPFRPAFAQNSAPPPIPADLAGPTLPKKYLHLDPNIPRRRLCLSLHWHPETTPISRAQTSQV